jgi:hypothetical protein
MFNLFATQRITLSRSDDILLPHRAGAGFRAGGLRGKPTRTAIGKEGKKIGKKG